MKLDRKEILTALETITVAGEGMNMVESGAVKNVITFGNEVVVDLVISTPAMHIKKRAEEDIKKLIHQNFSADIIVNVNIKVESNTKESVGGGLSNPIKGKQIQGISNIIAVASGKGGVGKSTISSNLAIKLSQNNKKIGLLDADIYGASIPSIFGIENEKVDVINDKLEPIIKYNI